MDAAAPVARRRFTVGEYDAMVAAGIFSGDEHVELLDGEIIVVSPQGPKHSAVTSSLMQRLVLAYGPTHAVREAKPMLAGDELPEPDHAVFRGSHRDYADRHPRGDESVLVVEVAWTSQALDRAKAATYARAAVGTYWLLDLAARRLEVHEGPEPEGRYRLVRVLGENDRIDVPVLGIQWRVGDLLQ